MFERFSERGRQVIVLAQDESRDLGHGFIGTEHLLLGVIREGGSASAALARAGLALETARATVANLVGVAQERFVSGQIPFTTEAKRAMQTAVQESIHRSSREVTPSLLLLGVLMQRSDTAACVVRDSGTDVARLANLLDVRGGVEASSITPNQEAKPEQLLSEAQSISEETLASDSDLSAITNRLTDRSRQVMVLAEKEARHLKHGYVGTEHMLLGLLHDEAGLAARVLSSLGLNVEVVRGKVVAVIGEGDGSAETELPLTPRSKKVLHLSLREALSLGHNYIGTEHILLALVRENEGVATRILLDFDIDAAKVRETVIKNLSSARPRSWSSSRQSQSDRRDDRGWENRIEVWEGADLRDRLDQLNELGSEGWRLASSIQNDDSIQPIFRRPKH